MERITSLLASLGNAGAVANARRACEERRFSELRLEAQLRALAGADPAAPPAAAASA